jgi:hypothetical protein
VVIIEPKTTSFTGGTRAGDIHINDRTKGFQRVWDLTLSDPTSITNIGHRSFDTKYAVTSHSEREKMEKYLDTDWYRQGIFQPIAISATGMLGECATAAFKLIKDTYELPDSFLSNIVSDIGIICAKYWARINLTGRVNIRFFSSICEHSMLGVG